MNETPQISQISAQKVAQLCSVTAQTLVTWTEWPDRPINPGEPGWEKIPDQVLPLAQVGKARVRALAQGVEPLFVVVDAECQTNLHWEWHPCSYPPFGKDLWDPPKPSPNGSKKGQKKMSPKTTFQGVVVWTMPPKECLDAPPLQTRGRKHELVEALG